MNEPLFRLDDDGAGSPRRRFAAPDPMTAEAAHGPAPGPAKAKRRPALARAAAPA
jgi:hypothetical protein